MGSSAIAVTRVQAAWSEWPWAGVMWPLRIQFQLAAKDWMSLLCKATSSVTISDSSGMKGQAERKG